MTHSRLDSFIARLIAQRAVIGYVEARLDATRGPIYELGLGNGRTYDHLRRCFPDREIWVFERDPKPHPACMPPEERLIRGALEETLEGAPARTGGRPALVHSDIGTGDRARNATIAAWLSKTLAPIVAPGGWIASDQELAAPELERRTAPDVPEGRYFLYRRRG